MNERAKIDVAAYYFPGWHADARNDGLRGAGWTEWELARQAGPLYDGHYQPRVPTWGYFDESDPAMAERQIELAVSHGVNVFHMDWYWYEDAPFLQGALENGILRAANAERIRFGIMWANHPWLDLFPVPVSGEKKGYFDADYSDAVMDHMIGYCIERYFSHPSYWKIDGQPVLSIFDLNDIVGRVGLDGTRRLIDRMQRQMREAGLPELHLNVCQKFDAAGADLHGLGIASATNYQAIWDPTYGDSMIDPKCLQDPRSPLIQDYARSVGHAQRHWRRMSGEVNVPYYPVLTQGWDSSPRGEQAKAVPSEYPWYPVIENNTPAQFEREAEAARQFVLEQPVEHKVVFVNAWNEWTEGSYLLPDRKYGDAYLQAMKRVFGR